MTGVCSQDQQPLWSTRPAAAAVGVPQRTRRPPSGTSASPECSERSCAVTSSCPTAAPRPHASFAHDLTALPEQQTASPQAGGAVHHRRADRLLKTHRWLAKRDRWSHLDALHRRPLLHLGQKVKELAATHWEIPTPANGKSPRRSLSLPCNHRRNAWFETSRPGVFANWRGLSPRVGHQTAFRATSRCFDAGDGACGGLVCRSARDRATAGLAPGRVEADGLSRQLQLNGDGIHDCTALTPTLKEECESDPEFVYVLDALPLENWPHSATSGCSLRT